MLIKVFRKDLNEKDDYAIDIYDDEKEAISPTDAMVIELLYDILKDKNQR